MTFFPGDSTIGTKYMKSLYRAYNDSSFKHAVEIPQWQGMMGPIFRAEVGDTLEIQVRNLASRNYSMHPHVSNFSHPEGPSSNMLIPLKTRV